MPETQLTYSSSGKGIFPEICREPGVAAMEVELKDARDTADLLEFR